MFGSPISELPCTPRISAQCSSRNPKLNPHLINGVNPRPPKPRTLPRELVLAKWEANKTSKPVNCQKQKLHPKSRSAESEKTLRKRQLKREARPRFWSLSLWGPLGSWSKLHQFRGCIGLGLMLDWACIWFLVSAGCSLSGVRFRLHL